MVIKKTPAFLSALIALGANSQDAIADCEPKAWYGFKQLFEKPSDCANTKQLELEKINADYFETAKTDREFRISSERSREPEASSLYQQMTTARQIELPLTQGSSRSTEETTIPGYKTRSGQ